uniref:Uncharacterized protein n=1 Tax=Arundo donax TaxID=35708 RepID=A0A0A9GH22_ARUDO
MLKASASAKQMPTKKFNSVP